MDLPTASLTPPRAGTGAEEPPPVAIVGAGFSGTITALNLLRALPPTQSVLLCERGAAFGRGPAYATEHPDHLLNVRAGNMSAFVDQPDSFESWLRRCVIDDTRRVRDTAAGIFASRDLYGRYLSAMLDLGMASVAGTGRLRLVPEEVIDLVPRPGGWTVVFASGATQPVASAVLAVGNLASGERDTGIYRSNAWTPGLTAGLRPGLPVLIVGTGLTTMDLAIALHEGGFAGPVVAVSRRALLPREHAHSAHWPHPHLSIAERSSLQALLVRVRREIAAAAAQGVDWRGVIDSLRPLTAELWRGLTERDRARFLRHLRPFWDVHRHRMAPPIAEMIAALRRCGYLTVIRGRLLGLEEHAHAGVALLGLRNGRRSRLVVQRVINATGQEKASNTGDRLLRQLLARGIARLDGLGLGLEVSEALQVVDGHGRAASNLWALGPVVRGMFWECTAVPDIRVQAARLATQLAR